MFSKDDCSAIVDANGVGYEVNMDRVSLAGINAGDEITIHVYTHMNDGAVELYGFALPVVKSIFLMLINVSGIGPKTALNILSGVEPSDLVKNIMESDVGRLSMIHGIGKKTAERLVVELRDKVVKLKALVPEIGVVDQISRDLKSALLNLGYRAAEIEAAIKDLRK
ncbi:MAG: Holliday junction branch migration protein RuvA, partial [Deltaproteobacteria bacterium]|nr:Holliday junction branch migration protein RuvA [Deltaproteobacteria bacterium]